MTTLDEVTSQTHYIFKAEGFLFNPEGKRIRPVTYFFKQEHQAQEERKPGEPYRTLTALAEHLISHEQFMEWKESHRHTGAQLQVSFNYGRFKAPSMIFIYHRHEHLVTKLFPEELTHKEIREFEAEIFYSFVGGRKK